MFVFIITSVWLKCVLFKEKSCKCGQDHNYYGLWTLRWHEYSVQHCMCSDTTSQALCILFSAFHANLCFWWSSATDFQSFWLGFTVALVGLSAWLRVDYLQDVSLGLRELLHQTRPMRFLLVRSFLATKELDFLTSSHLASYCCNFFLYNN